MIILKTVPELTRYYHLNRLYIIDLWNQEDSCCIDFLRHEPRTKEVMNSLKKVNPHDLPRMKERNLH